MTASLDDLLHDVHAGMASPANQEQLVRGKYSYYHYTCDSVDDRGWGCGYRTLQTICSWMYYNHKKSEKLEQGIVPCIADIQSSLVNMNDKPKNFVKSREWIGSFEVCLCLDYFFDVPSKIHHVRADEHLYGASTLLWEHFTQFGSPVMMGGDTDSASKCVLGICGNEQHQCHILILDPHCQSNQPTVEELHKENWISWRNINSFDDTSFYNLCLPQISAL